MRMLSHCSLVPLIPSKKNGQSGAPSGNVLGKETATIDCSILKHDTNLSFYGWCSSPFRLNGTNVIVFLHPTVCTSLVAFVHPVVCNERGSKVKTPPPLSAN